MKDKKVIILIVVALILIISVLIIVKNKKQSNQHTKAISEVQYDNENGVYYIKNEITGEIIANSTDESGLQMYIDNPDYNPNPLQSYSDIEEQKKRMLIKKVFNYEN